LNEGDQAIKVNSINSRLKFVADAEQSGNLSNKESTFYKGVKKNINHLNHQTRSLRNSLAGHDQELQDLETELQKLIDNLILSLEKKLEESLNSIESQLQKKESQDLSTRNCIEEELNIAKRFRANIQEGKKSATWINTNLGEFTKSASKYALKWRLLNTPINQIFRKYSEDDYEQFYLSIEQLLERISHCMIWGRSHILEVYDIPLIFDWRFHRRALNYVRRLAHQRLKSGSSCLSEKSVDQIDDYINCLIKVLPSYPTDRNNT
jgi:chromosome segregation ATPase